MNGSDLTTADLAVSIVTKSDQLNADDLVGGPLTGRVVRVTKGSPEQPVEVHVSSWKVPWKPCKTERRVLIAIWGDDPRAWIGRTLRLRRDPAVAFGGANVGGIRIEGASHIDAAVSVMLNARKGAKARRTVEPIAAQTAPTVMLPEWAAGDINEPLSPEQADEIAAMVTACGVSVDAVTAKHGKPETWSTATARAIVDRLRAVRGAK
jgi:hypothetical protein